MSTSPASLTADQIEVLFANLPGVRDGNVESIHDARVSTRRLRELLRLADAEAGRSTGPAYQLVRSAGRALGTVREIDSLVTLCGTLMNLQPAAAGALAMMRGRLIDERRRAERRLVKKLDALDLEPLRDTVTAVRHRVLAPDTRVWKAALRERIQAHGHKLAAAVERASGVYFPKRLHRVRVQLKKLRYLTEIAEQTRTWRPAHLRRDAARVQDLLGDIHDRQVLLERLESADSDRALTATLRADIADRHAQYLLRRDRLRLMAAACERYVAGQPARPWLRLSGAALAVVVPAAGMALAGRTVRALTTTS
jgi:CHAD domain-containing protein